VQWLETTAWNFYQHWLKHYTMYYPKQVLFIPGCHLESLFL
jgi:hypothetical protein